MVVSPAWQALYDKAPKPGKYMMQKGLERYLKCLQYKKATAVIAATYCRDLPGGGSCGEAADEPFVDHEAMHEVCEKEKAALERSVVALERAYLKLSKIDKCRVTVEGVKGATGVTGTLRLHPTAGTAAVKLSHDDGHQLCRHICHASGITMTQPSPHRRRRRVSDGMKAE